MTDNQSSEAVIGVLALAVAQLRGDITEADVCRIADMTAERYREMVADTVAGAKAIVAAHAAALSSLQQSGLA